MLRVEVREQGQDALPPIDIADDVFVIGSAIDARVRLPAEAVSAEHVRVERGRWRALGPVEHVVDDTRAGKETVATSGEVGPGVELAIGRYRVRIAPAPPGVAPTPPQRTESLARELARSLLGTQGAPFLVVERGPVIGEKRLLAPPESTLVIGRGDEAGWVLLDEDLSRAHAEIRRGWDGARIADLGSKNGTRVDGVEVSREGIALRDGALIELGKVALRFTDLADRARLAEQASAAQVTVASADARAATPVPAAAVSAVAVGAARDAGAAADPAATARAPGAERPSTVPFYAALAVCLAASGGLVWILAS